MGPVLRDMTPEERIKAELLRITVLENPFIPEEHREPHPRQAAFLVDPRREVLYGGSAGSGKTSALLVAALQMVDQSGYSALILRRSYQDLALPGAIMDRALEWLRPNPDVKWNHDSKTFVFPSGARLAFGYLQSRDDHLRYQGSELTFCAFDELTQFQERQYRYLFSRLRRPAGRVGMPIRMRAASNPGGPGHVWVRQRFIDAVAHDRGFVPAKLADNPSLDRREYVASLAHLDPVTRAQLLDGDWNTRREGGLFRREWFRVVDTHEVPQVMASAVRWWDLAGGGEDGDLLVGVLLGRCRQGRYWILDMVRVRQRAAEFEATVKRTAERDGRVLVAIGLEPGGAGGHLVDHYRRNILPGRRVEGVRETGSKFVRAQPLAGQAHAGNVSILRGPWNEAIFDELEAFTPNENEYDHDDQVDSLSGAYGLLAKGGVAVALEDLIAFGGSRRTEP